MNLGPLRPCRTSKLSETTNIQVRIPSCSHNVLSLTPESAGSLPSSFTNLSSLTTLEFQATGLATLSDSLFDSLRNVSTLKLIRNANMSSALPSTVAKLPIQNLYVPSPAQSDSADRPIQGDQQSSAHEPARCAVQQLLRPVLAHSPVCYHLVHNQHALTDLSVILPRRT